MNAHARLFTPQLIILVVKSEGEDTTLSVPMSTACLISSAVFLPDPLNVN